MNRWGWAPYVPLAERRLKADNAASKMLKKGQKVLPVRLEGKKISTTFWGKAWCRHLESSSDRANRLLRGRTYVRNGSVIHLDIDPSRAFALVQGTALYKVSVRIKGLNREKWSEIRGHCSGEIGSVIELLQGRLSSDVIRTMIDRDRGLFPAPKEMTFTCSCPDRARMCKHVAAVLYGIGHRLDQRPELLFKLRNVDHMELMDGARLKQGAASGRSHIIKGRDLSEIFGIEIAEDRPAMAPSRSGKAAVKKKKRPKKR
ncbi:MAG: SWIM zinc finger family protein [Candidatus Omnitrophica bacterium]|nr:SWIM zinc finger family protein [Candidatus Omnitrophota bacterium]